MTARITPLTPLHELTGRTVVVSSIFLVGPLAPFILQCTARYGQVHIRYAQLASRNHHTALVPGYRRLEHFAHDRLGIETIGKIVAIDGVTWRDEPRLRLPAGLAIEDLYPGVGELHGHRSTKESYILGTVEAPADPEAARRRVTEVKESYGALLTDVVYRIENSALFDNAVPESKEFQLELMRWDDHQARLTADELQELSRSVALAFDTARANAERIGLKHLPLTARRTAHQAAKAATLARSASTEGEREAARAKVAKLLARLGLYYLPSARKAPLMLGGQPAQLPSAASPPRPAERN